MNKPFIAILIVLVVVAAAITAVSFRGSPAPVPTPTPTPTPTANPSLSAEPSKPEVLNLIRVNSPRPGDEISSPFKITGEARGNWFFEASFPVVLTNWDGLIIAQGIATAKGDWMTTEFVPYEATLSFTKPTCMEGADYCKRGSLILQRSNASGLPENDAALEIPVFFK